MKAQRLEMYRALFPEAVVADLMQNPEARRRCGHADMPTLTRACTSLVHIPTGHIYGCVSAFSRVELVINSFGSGGGSTGCTCTCGTDGVDTDAPSQKPSNSSAMTAGCLLHRLLQQLLVLPKLKLLESARQPKPTPAPLASELLSWSVFCKAKQYTV